MELLGKERKNLRELILKTYPNEEELQVLLSEELEIDFGAIAEGGEYNTRVFNLIRYCEAQGRLVELVDGLSRGRPRSSQLKEMVADMRSRDENTPLTPKRARIFISYKREVQPDDKVALQLEKALSERNDVAIDRNMRIGTDWLTWIDEQIQRSDFLVVLLSSESVLSEMVQLEIEKARQHHQKQGHPQILPVRLAYREPFQYPLSEYLNPLNWALWQSEADTPALIAEIEKALQGDEMSLNNETQKAAVVQSPAPTNLRPPQPMAQLHKLELPEGTMDLESKFYVERDEDRLALETIRRQGVTITIKGPRQMGKSSLLNRVMKAAREMDKQVVYLDFQLFESEILHDGDRFFQEFCSWLSEELNVEDRVADYWKKTMGNSQRCTRYVGRHLLGSLDKPLVLAMDEVETIFDTPFRSDFFGMLRSWHNNRAVQPLWKKLDLALVTSTEPYQLIADLNQSPFNVGQVLELSDFTLEQVQDLNRRHGQPLSAEQERQLMGLVNGQPYLIRRALYLVASGQRSLSDLFAQATEDRGPFGDHLRYHLFRVYNRPELVEGLKQALWQPTVLDERIFFRLRGAGLLSKQGQKAIPRCQLYEAYFREHLGR